MTMQVDKARLDEMLAGLGDKVRSEIMRSASILRPAELATAVDATIEIHVRQSLRSLRSTEGKGPDHCYDPDDWEYTMPWEDRNEFVEQWDVNTPHRVATLIDGPERWCVLHWDEVNGVETSWYHSEAEARAALTRSPE